MCVLCGHTFGGNFVIIFWELSFKLSFFLTPLQVLKFSKSKIYLLQWLSQYWTNLALVELVHFDTNAFQSCKAWPRIVCLHMKASSCEVFIQRGLLSLRSSSCDVVFVWCLLLMLSSFWGCHISRLSSCEIIFLIGFLPQRSSSSEVVFL